ncbi:hypothetical protein SAMN05216404_106208 [Nitrosospira multiformis]|uniref:Uncharacterized protein n=1 Tax=Nitrosospira multiformis TaxID=1231 RepID=A0A1H8IWP7_9PROT|nr:hypothetical protein [Nitrosospira multiformis]SEN72861.1 hypothetical protein SAMN05216404_106208 [Nitrosospira multiformis]
MKIKLAVIVSDFGAAANCGGNVEFRTRVFDLPDEVVQHIQQSKNKWTNVSLAIHEEPKED